LKRNHHCKQASATAKIDPLVAAFKAIATHPVPTQPGGSWI